MTRRRQLAAPAAPNVGVDHLFHVLRDQLRRADAFVSTAEELIEESWGDEGDEDDDSGEDGVSGVQRRRMRVEYLIEAGKLEVRAANRTRGQLAAELAARRGYT